MKTITALFRKGWNRRTFPIWGSLLLGCLGGVFFYYLASQENPQEPLQTVFTVSEVKNEPTKRETSSPTALENEKTTENHSEQDLPELPELPALPELPDSLSLSEEMVPEKEEAGNSDPIPDKLSEIAHLPELPLDTAVERADWKTKSSEKVPELQQVHFEEPIPPTLPKRTKKTKKINRLAPPPDTEEIPIFNPALMEKGELDEATPISRLDAAAMSRQPNADILVSPPLPEVVSIEARNTDLRLLLSRVKTQSGLKIYASPDVQGKVSCKIESHDSEEVFRRLLGTTAFTAWREGDLVYVGRRTEQEALPKPLSQMGMRTFAPQHIPIEQLSKTVNENLSPYGESFLVNGRSLQVHDLELALRDLEKIVELIDIRGKVPKWDIFVFQHEASSRKQPLDLQKIAENRGLTLQETAPQWIVPEKFSKKEVPPCRVFTISHRMDTFLIGLEDQKNVMLISDRNGENDLVLETPQPFPFSLKLGKNQENYVAEVTFSTPADAEITPGTLAVKMDCRPQQEESKAEPFVFQTTVEMERGLLLQGFLTEYKPEKEEIKPFQSLPGKKTPVEMILALITRLEEPPRPQTTLSSAAIRYLAKQQETIGHKIKESAQGEERKTAQSFLQTSQRLRNLVYDVQIHP